MAEHLSMFLSDWTTAERAADTANPAETSARPHTGRPGR
jgi:hypothetical protein